jgi:hypothetical protein
VTKERRRSRLRPMARLDRLGTAKGVLQIGAIIGGEFSYELIQAVTEHLPSGGLAFYNRFAGCTTKGGKPISMLTWTGNLSWVGVLMSVSGSTSNVVCW